MFDPAVLIAYTVAAAAVVIVPGPTISLIIANSLRRGSAAGLANVAGTQVGLVLMIGVLAVGLDVVVRLMGEAFVFIKLAGAAYLIYLGIRLWRSDGKVPGAKGEVRSLLGYAVQGFFVIWSNPKALLFFGAFIPQFVSPDHAAVPQVVVYGLVFVVTATVLDSLYALAAGSAGSLLTKGRVRLVERLSGTFLIAGGVWLATARR